MISEFVVRSCIIGCEMNQNRWCLANCSASIHIGCVAPAIIFNPIFVGCCHQNGCMRSARVHFTRTQYTDILVDNTNAMLVSNITGIPPHWFATGIWQPSICAVIIIARI